MESNITSSFIPRDTGSAPVSYGVQTGSGPTDLLFLGSVILLVTSAAMGIAVFLYAQFLSTSITNKTTQLKRAQEAFEPALVQELTRLDTRMNAAHAILLTHVAPSALFNLLEQATLQNVTFKSFSFDAADVSGMVFTMKGLARSVNSVALQADIFGKNSAVENPVFSNINRVEEGVSFDVTAHINPAAVNYQLYIQTLNAQANPAPASTQQDAQAAQAAQDASVFTGAPAKQQ